MANNDDFDDVDDIDVGSDGVASAAAPVDTKAGLKALWESNPFVKIGAVVAIGAALFAGYTYFLGGDGPAAGEQSMIVSENAGAKGAVPASQEVDPAYKKAVEEKNQQGVEMAQATGETFIPTPIGTPNAGQIEIPDITKKGDSDPLAEWRRAAEANRLNAGQKEEEVEDTGPEVIPMAQPAPPQVQQQVDPQMAQALTEQMRMIISAQEPKDGKTASVTTQKSRYMRMLDEQARQAAAASSSSAANASGLPGGAPGTAGSDKKEAKTIVSAGNVSYGQLMNSLNSDVPGPVLVHVLSGPLAGGRAIGKFDMKDEYLVLEFKRIVKDGVSYKVDAVALDEATTLTGLNSDVDHHYLARIVLPAAAEFVSGMGEAASQPESTTTTGSGGATTTDTAKPSTHEQVLKGVQKSADKISEIIDEGSKMPVTVKLKQGTTMGLLFMDPVKDTDVEK